MVPVVPDAPIGHFRLDLLGGKQGYLVNTRNLCGAPATIEVSYSAHSGKKKTQRVRAKTACDKSRAQRKGHRR